MGPGPAQASEQFRDGFLGGDMSENVPNHEIFFMKIKDILMKIVFLHAYHVWDPREAACGAPRVHLWAPGLHKHLSSSGTGFWEGI